MLNKILSMFGLQAARPIRASIASFDAARPMAELENHWRYAASTSPNRDADSATRSRLRNLARHEIKNNCYARGMITTLANDTIGRGPRIQMLSTANQAIEEAWRTWSRSVRLAQKLRTARAAKAGDGEVFIRLINDRRRSNQLDVRLYETDQIASPIWGEEQYFDENRHVDGIKLDGNGNPVAYHILHHHPYGMYNTSTFGIGEGQWVPERNVIHMFSEARAGQRHGIPEITPALPLYAMLRRYTLAVVAAAETAADIAGVVKTDAGALTMEDVQQVDPGVQFPIRRRTLMSLPFGWEMQQLKAEQPTTTYGEFHNAVLNEIARCLHMPFNVAAGDSSDYNYASGRLDHQTYFRALDVERSEIEDYCLEKIFDAWIREHLATTSGIRPSDIDVSLYPHRWYWDPHPHVDPEKEAKAVVTLWEKGLITDDDYWLQAGKDPEVQYTQLEAQAKRRTAADLPRPGVVSQQIDMTGGENPGKSNGETPRNKAETQTQAAE